MYRFVFLPAFALSTSALLSTTPAIAGPIYESQSGGTFTFYGQFSPAWADFDDGDDSQGKLADNAKSNSRVGFLIVQPFDIYELNFKFETALGFRQTSSISQLDSPDSFDWDREKLRHVDFAFKTPRFGTFYLGQGSMGSDNIGDRNLSQTTVASDVTISDVAASYYLRRDDGSLSDITVASAFNNYEGSRRGRIRYDSPSYMGVTLRTSYGRNILDSDDDDDYWDIALAYDNELSNGTKIAAGLAYAYRDRDDGEDDLKDTFGTMSVLLPSGINMTLSAGDRDDAGSYYYAQLGYIADWTAWGTTAMAVSYYDAEDMVTDGDSASSWSLNLVQNIERYDLDLYMGYTSYEYDDDDNDYQDADSYMIGARWKF